MTRPDPAASAAVLIGVARYEDERLPPLPGVTNNLVDLAAVLRDPDGLGLAPDRCVQVANPEFGQSVAATLTRAADRARDTLLVYLSGHGLLNGAGELVLATTKTVAESPELQGLSYRMVRDIVRGSRAMRRIVVVDCCFSGLAARAMAGPESLIVGQLQAQGSYVLTSAPENSPALADPAERNTAFTGALLTLANSGDPGHPGAFFTLDDVYRQLLHRLSVVDAPSPQRLASNTVERLMVFRNRAFGRAERQPGRGPASRWSPELVDGLRAAVADVAPRLGRPDLDAAEVGAPTTKGPGRPAVRALMLTMRQQYGDGARTAAVLLGGLVEGVDEALRDGGDPDRLAHQLRRSAEQVRRRLLAGAAPAGPDELDRAVRSALGDTEPVRLVLRACRETGAGDVEVLPSSSGPLLLPTVTLTFPARVTAPNLLPDAVTLQHPLVAVAPDGRLSVAALRRAAVGRRHLLVVAGAPVGNDVLRGLRRTYRSVAVVRPDGVRDDLVWLGTQVDEARTVLAGRVLVTPAVTMIADVADPRGDAPVGPEQRGLLVHAGPAGGPAFERAVRAVAVVRSVAVAGTLPGGAGGAEAAAAGLEGDGGRILAGALAGVVATITRNRAGRPDGDPLDSRDTVAGALDQAVAAVGRYL